MQSSSSWIWKLRSPQSTFLNVTFTELSYCKLSVMAFWAHVSLFTVLGIHVKNCLTLPSQNWRKNPTCLFIYLFVCLSLPSPGRKDMMMTPMDFYAAITPDCSLVHGMGAGAHMEVSTWVHEYRSTWLYAYISTWVHKYRSLLVQEYRSTGVHEYISTGVY